MVKQKQKAKQYDIERKVTKSKHISSVYIDGERQNKNHVEHTKSCEESEASNSSKEELSSIPNIPHVMKTRRSCKASIEHLTEDTTETLIKKTQNSKAGNSVKSSININSVDAIVDEGKLQVEPIPVTQRKRKSSMPISNETSKVKKKVLEGNIVNNGFVFMKNELSESNTVQSEQSNISVENSIQQTIQPPDKRKIKDQCNQTGKGKSMVNGKKLSNKSKTTNDLTNGIGKKLFASKKSQLKGINSNCPLSTDVKTNVKRGKKRKYRLKKIEQVKVSVVPETDLPELTSTKKIIDSVTLNTEKTKVKKQNGHNRVKNNGALKNTTKSKEFTQKSVNLSAVSKANILDTDLESNEIQTRGRSKSFSVENTKTFDKDQQTFNGAKQKVVEKTLESETEEMNRCKTSKILNLVASKVYRKYKKAAGQKRGRKRKTPLTIEAETPLKEGKDTNDQAAATIEVETPPVESKDTKDQTKQSPLINKNSDTVDDRSLNNKIMKTQDTKNLTVKIVRLEDQPLFDILKLINNSKYRNYCVERDKRQNSTQANLEESTKCNSIAEKIDQNKVNDLQSAMTEPEPAPTKCDCIEEEFDKNEVNDSQSLMTEQTKESSNNILEDTTNKSLQDLNCNDQDAPVNDDIPLFPETEEVQNCLEENNIVEPNDPYLSENCKEKNVLNEQNLQLLSADSTCNILNLLEDSPDFMGDFPVNNHMPSDEFLSPPDELFDSISKEFMTGMEYSENLEFSEPSLDFDKEFCNSNSNPCHPDNINALNDLIVSNSQSGSEPTYNIEQLKDNILSIEAGISDKLNISPREKVLPKLPSVTDNRDKSATTTHETSKDESSTSDERLVCNICMATFDRVRQLAAHTIHHKRNPLWKKGIHSTFLRNQVKKRKRQKKQVTAKKLKRGNNISSLQCTENKENKVIEKNSCTRNFCHSPAYTDDNVEVQKAVLKKNIEKKTGKSEISCNVKRKRGRPRQNPFVLNDKAVSDKTDDVIPLEKSKTIQDEPSTETNSEIRVQEHVPSTSTTGDEEIVIANTCITNTNESQSTIDESVQKDVCVQQSNLTPENELLIENEQGSEDESDPGSIATDIDECCEELSASEELSFGDSPKKYRKWHCNLCNENFALLRNYLRHKYYSHNDETAVHICDNCTKVLTSVAMVNIHVCTNVKAWSCKRCNMNFSDRLSLTRHNMQNHFETVGPHKCVVCYSNFLTKYMLDRHKLMHHNATDCLNSDICYSSVLENDKLSGGVHPALRDNRNSIDDLKTKSTTVVNLLNYRNRMIGGIKKLYLDNVFTVPKSSGPLRDVSKEPGITYTFCNGEEKFYCELCNIECLTRLQVELHLKRQHNLNVDTCQLCGDLYIPTNFMAHLIERHIVFDSCDADQYPIKSVKYAENRFTYDLDTPYGLLKILGSKRFMSLKQYDSLYNEQTAEYINCTPCSEEYLNVEGYIFHQVQTHDTACIFCNIQFQHSSQAVQHKIDTHKSIASYIWGVQKIIQTIVIMENYYSSLDQITLELANVKLSNGELCSTSSEANSKV